MFHTKIWSALYSYRVVDRTFAIEESKNSRKSRVISCISIFWTFFLFTGGKTGKPGKATGRSRWAATTDRASRARACVRACCALALRCCGGPPLLLPRDPGLDPPPDPTRSAGSLSASNWQVGASSAGLVGCGPPVNPGGGVANGLLGKRE